MSKFVSICAPMIAAQQGFTIVLYQHNEARGNWKTEYPIVGWQSIWERNTEDENDTVPNYCCNVPVFVTEHGTAYNIDDYSDTFASVQDWSILYHGQKIEDKYEPTHP